MGTRSRRNQDSLSSSWAAADYTSDADGSVHTASDSGSDAELEALDLDVNEDVTDSFSSRIERKTLNRSIRPTPQNLAISSSGSTRKAVRPSSNVNPLDSTKHVNSSDSTKRQQALARDARPEPSFFMPTMQHAYNNPPSGSPSKSSGSQVRERNARRSRLHNHSAVSEAGAQQRNSYQDSNEPEKEEVGPWHYLNLFWQHVIWPLSGHFIDILSYALRHFVKPVLGFALGVGILVLGIQFLGGLVRSSISNALITPICMLPGSSYIVTACVTSAMEGHPQANFEELIDVQGRFEDIVGASKDTSTLPSTIKNSELAIRDLRTLVRYSRLPSRRELDNEFEYFVQTAAEASVDLSRYNSRIGATMDRVIATNAWTMNVLQGISEQQASIGTASRVYSAVARVFSAPPLTLQQRVFEQYLLHVSKNKAEITRLIETAQALLQVLNNLDGRLGTIFEIATNDDNTITRNQEELLSSLWTKLGGNRSDVKANAQSLNLLKNISVYRKKAIMHVSETLLKLQEIQAELENLREGVAAPEVLGHRSEVPLSYHIELIEKSVERLRISRGDAMRVEGETVRKLMHGEGAPRELPGPIVTANVK
ncbi:hypothetical protein ACN47E_006990 [Coniothyrium glycines]